MEPDFEDVRDITDAVRIADRIEQLTDSGELVIEGALGDDAALGFLLCAVSVFLHTSLEISDEIRERLGQRGVAVSVALASLDWIHDVLIDESRRETELN